MEGINNRLENMNTSLTFGQALTVAFVALKLIDKIDWNWFWVISPIIIEIICCVAFVGIIAVLTKLAEKKSIKKK